ncbi:MAG: AAA family ATPase [Hyphomonadaceae bacterium]
MQTAAQKAKARARQRTQFAAPANDNLARSAPPLELTAGDVIHEEAEDAPFEPPPADDIFGLAEIDEDEETIFVSNDSAPEFAEAFDAEAFEEDAPFDPPELDDEPVFSPPASVQLEPVAAPAPKAEAPTPKAAETRRDRPLPAINVYMGWDRAEAEAVFRQLAADPRLARAEIQISRGGLDGALAAAETDLFVVDSNLEGAAMLAALDRLRAKAPSACIVMLGAVNDIALLRELAARGVSDYIVPPADPDQVARSLCALFADEAPAQVIAVIGARGGVGASTIARNIAWSIAERQQRKATLVDLDLCFGLAATSLGVEATLSVLDVVSADDPDAVLTEALTKPAQRLNLLAAPTKTESLELDLLEFDTLLANVRRTSSHVVLDLPHAWEPWMRAALREADEVVVVAGPDLASLRNADNMLKLLRSERDQVSAPKIVLSMTGLPKRPEIPLKEFAQALHAEPAMMFAFEPELFAAAETAAKTIYEAMPDSRAALQLDTLAAMLTGHEPHAQPAARKVRAASTADKPASSELPVLELVTPAPVEQERATSRRKQRVARTGFIALQEPVQPKRRSTGLVRFVAAVAALAALGVWFVEKQRALEALPREAPASTFSV